MREYISINLKKMQIFRHTHHLLDVDYFYKRIHKVAMNSYQNLMVEAHS